MYHFKKKSLLFLLLGVVICIVAGYCIYVFTTSMSVSQLENYAKTNSLRNSEEFLIVSDNKIGNDFILYISKEQDETQTKSQEIFVFKKRKSLIPFVTRYYSFTETAGSQMYLPADKILITENGENFKNGLNRSMILYSANEAKISRIQYVIDKNGENILENYAVLPNEAFAVIIANLGLIKGESGKFLKADFYDEGNNLIFSTE